MEDCPGEIGLPAIGLHQVFPQLAWFHVRFVPTVGDGMVEVLRQLFPTDFHQSHQGHNTLNFHHGLNGTGLRKKMNNTSATEQNTWIGRGNTHVCYCNSEAELTLRHERSAIWFIAYTCPGAEREASYTLYSIFCYQIYILYFLQAIKWVLGEEIAWGEIDRINWWRGLNWNQPGKVASSQHMLL